MKDATGMFVHQCFGPTFLIESTLFRTLIGQKQSKRHGKVSKRIFAAEAVDSGSIPDRVKPKTVKIDNHSFLT